MAVVAEGLLGASLTGAGWPVCVCVCVCVCVYECVCVCMCMCYSV